MSGLPIGTISNDDDGTRLLSKKAESIAVSVVPKLLMRRRSGESLLCKKIHRFIDQPSEPTITIFRKSWDFLFSTIYPSNGRRIDGVDSSIDILFCSNTSNNSAGSPRTCCGQITREPPLLNARHTSPMNTSNPKLTTCKMRCAAPSSL